MEGQVDRVKKQKRQLRTTWTGFICTWISNHYCTMELDHASSPNKVVHHVDIGVPEVFEHKTWASKDPLAAAPEFPFTSPCTTDPTHMHIAAETIDSSSSKQTYVTVAKKSTSPLEQSKAKIACLRCRGKKSRCSGQRPCGGCSNDGLDCVWDDDEAKSKRGRRSRSAEAKGKVSKGKDQILQVRSACTRCQHRKAKCTGTRPACAYCVERQLECTYDVAEGETRTNDLKRKLKDAEIKAQAFGRILAVMREGNIYQATEVLARLRMGETPRDVLQSLPTSIASASPIGEALQSGLDRRFST